MAVYRVTDTLEEHDDRVWCVAWNSTGTRLASCGSDREIKIWTKFDNNKWRLASSLCDSHSKTIRSVAFSPCDRYLASSSFDATVAVWEKKEQEYEVVTTLEGHENEVKCVTWSPSGQYLASCSRDKSVWLWEIDEDDEFECCSVLPAHQQDVKAVAWKPGVDVLASASYDDTVKLYEYDGDDWAVVHTLTGHESTVWSIAFNADGSRLASGSADLSVRIWQQYSVSEKTGIFSSKVSAQWKCVATLNGYYTEPIYSVSWCHITDLLATGCGDNKIRLFKESEPSASGDSQTPSYDLVLTIDSAHSQDINSVRWNPKSRGVLASGGDDGLVKVWSIDVEAL